MQVLLSSFLFNKVTALQQKISTAIFSLQRTEVLSWLVTDQW